MNSYLRDTLARRGYTNSFGGGVQRVVNSDTVERVFIEAARTGRSGDNTTVGYATSIIAKGLSPSTPHRSEIERVVNERHSYNTVEQARRGLDAQLKEIDKLYKKK